MEELIRRKEVMERLGFRSTVGFSKFAEANNFPKPIKSQECLQGRVLYFKSEVEQWFRERKDAAARV